jgi:hypothetical protein
MKLLVFSEPVPGADRSRYAVEEEETIQRLRREGFIQHIYVRTDGSGAVTVVESGSLEECLETLQQLPLVSNGCLSVETIPVTELEESSRPQGSESLSNVSQQI